MLKKIIAFILVIASVLSFTACGEAAYVSNATQMPTKKPAVVEATPTPTVYPETKTIEMSQLSEYTIVYPSAYTEFRMDIVNELKNVIEQVLGCEINTASDVENIDGKKIILASANAEHSFKTEIENFDDAMDHLIAVDGDNIVLGGKNYYSDMRAMYAFAENNLGYTSIGNAYFGETKAINGVNFTYYEKPEFFINAVTWNTTFTKEEYVKDVADGSFNIFTTFIQLCNEQEAHNITKWSAKYDLWLMSVWNGEGPRWEMMKYSELYWDCPVIYGGYMWDEPSLEQMLDVDECVTKFIDNYSQYGWKPFINYSTKFWIDTPYAMDCEAVAYDWYAFICYSYDQDGSREGELTLKWLKDFKEFADTNNKVMWTYIQAYRKPNGPLNSSKAYRWQMYMDLCFGAEGIMYYEYINMAKPEEMPWMDTTSMLLYQDFTKSYRYDYARLANDEILKVYDILKDYSNAGAYTINKKDVYFSETDKSKTIYGEFDEYGGFGVIEDLQAPIAEDGKKTMYLVGCYDKYNSDDKAFILMNMEKMNDVEFGEDAESIARVKINGKNPKFYFAGEEVTAEQDSEGYYLLNIPNGNCWLVTVE